MNAGTGERLRPLPSRDRRGRFVSGSDKVQVWEQPPPPPSEEALLWHFDLKGWCRFPDPWTDDGWFVIETRESLKHFPVAMRYEGPLLEEDPEYGCVIKYNTELFSRRYPPGEVAVSPMPHFGDPGDPWEGHWVLAGNRELARLYIHLVQAVNLHEVGCGEMIGYVESGHRRYV